MNLRDFEYIKAVAKWRHFSKAAKAVNVSQPTLSSQIKKFEDYWQIKLFERSNKQVLLTPMGQKLMPFIDDILNRTSRFEDFIKSSKDPYGGQFRLGAFPTLAPYLFPKIIKPIQAQFDQLAVLLVEEKTDTLIKQLKNGDLDAALLALPIDEKTFDHLPIFSDSFYLCVPKTHALAKRKSMTQVELENLSLLLLEEGHCLADQALNICNSSQNFQDMNYRATSLPTLLQMVRMGLGITLIPEIAVTNDYDDLVFIKIEGKQSHRKIGLFYRHSSTRQKLTQALSEIFKNI